MEKHPPVSLADEGPRHRYFTANHYLIVLIVFLVAAPFLDQFSKSRLLEGFFLSAVLLAALPAAGISRKALILGVLLVTPALGFAWINKAWPQALPHEIETVAALIFVAFVIVQLLRYILTAKRVSTDVLSAAMAGYLTLGIFWAFAYVLLAQYKPNAFSFTDMAMPDKTMVRFQAIYFSLVTLTTTGYGDIVPIDNVARMMAMLEAICGTFYLTILVARLVAIYSSKNVAEVKI